MLRNIFNKLKNRAAARNETERALLNGALISATYNQDMQAIRDLLRRGAAVDARPDGNYTALMIAAADGFAEGVAHFLSCGADPGILNNFGQNALLISLRERHEDIALTLIKPGGNVDVRDKFGNTPLFCCAQNGFAAAAAKLIEAGADVNKPAREGKTPLNWAAALGHMDVVDLLLAAKADPNIADDKGWTPLMHAVNVGNRPLAEKLLAAGANIRHVNAEGESILDIARLQDRREIAAMIEEKLQAEKAAYFAPIREGTTAEVKPLKTIALRKPPAER